MIEHFSKRLELVPLLGHNSEETTYAFMDMVPNRFCVLTKIFIDQGTNVKAIQ
jgi:hypothetical protein